jgi:hypothetical protein
LCLREGGLHNLNTKDITDEMQQMVEMDGPDQSEDV